MCMLYVILYIRNYGINQIKSKTPTLIWESGGGGSAAIFPIYTVHPPCADTGFFFGDRNPPLRLSAIFFCLLICPGPCNNLDPLLKFLYETPPLLNPGSAPALRLPLSRRRYLNLLNSAFRRAYQPKYVDNRNL